MKPIIERHINKDVRELYKKETNQPYCDETETSHGEWFKSNYVLWMEKKLQSLVSIITAQKLNKDIDALHNDK